MKNGLKGLRTSLAILEVPRNIKPGNQNTPVSGPFRKGHIPQKPRKTAQVKGEQVLRSACVDNASISPRKKRAVERGNNWIGTEGEGKTPRFPSTFGEPKGKGSGGTKPPTNQRNANQEPDLR